MAPLDHETIGLTSYRIPIDAMAAQAVALVDSLVRTHQADAGGVLLTGDLVRGRTTGPLTTTS